MSTITQILNWIANSLLLPVIVLLLAALVTALIALGGFCATYLGLVQEKNRRKKLLKLIKANQPLTETILANGGIFAGHLRELAEFNWQEIECAKRIAELQLGYEKELEHARFLTKAAPMLGLMGTLIPMGPALAGLASGNIQNMAYNMQIAFATTVVGCLVAGIELLILTVKKYWYNEEIADLNYVLDRHLEENSK